MKHYRFHIDEYRNFTRHLSWEEDAAHRRLLDAYYTGDGPLPADMREIYRLVLATTESQREAVQVVLQEFFELTDGGWVNRRADAEIALMRGLQQKQRAKAEKRWRNAPKRGSDAPEVAAPINRAAASPDDSRRISSTPTGRASAGAITWALSRAGMQRANPSHPKLLALLAAGATMDQFLAAWADAKGREQADAFSHVLDVVEVRCREAQAMTEKMKSKRAQEDAGSLTGAQPIERNSQIFDVDSRTPAAEIPTGGFA